jgi:1-acyl-sn-glycerol-3-phosphate acyltransferase
MERYFSGSLIPAGRLSADEGPYLFAFHPHGIYPITCFWITRGSLWRDAYGELDVDICGASVMFHSPILREFVMWAGGREVSKRALDHALDNKRSILLIPGGQREMRHSSIDADRLVLVTRHKGFVKIALTHGAPLVPVLSLGENQLLANIRMPAMQELTTRILGFGLPHYPYGRWYSPLPNAQPVTVIVGEPLRVPRIERPTEDDVNQWHQKYYDQLRALFETHKAAAGFPNCQLIYSEH